MACVALFIAIMFQKIDAGETLCRTVTNPAYTSRPWGWGSRLTFGHSWLVLGPEGERHCVDPWAGVCCKEEDFPGTFRAKMKKWADGGKRIAVGWKDSENKDSAWWTHPQDGAIFALFAADAVVQDTGAHSKFPRKP